MCIRDRASDRQNIGYFGLSLILYMTSMGGFATAISKIDMSIAYAIWSALGSTIVTISAIVFFGESFDLMKAISLTLIVLGVVGLNLRDAQ